MSARALDGGALRWRFRLLLVAVICSGAFEVFDNLLGLRTANFDSSAPAAFKVAKEIVIVWILIGLLKHRSAASLNLGWAAIASLILVTLVPQVWFLPTESHERFGLVYFIGSVAVLVLATALCTRDLRPTFARQFLFPFLCVCLATQVGEALLAPSSFYGEVNLLGLDRRAGIAVIPTTAGLLGVIGMVSLRRFGRLVALLVVLMANSSLSLVCLALILGTRVRPRWAVPLALPLVVAMAVWGIGQREGARPSAESRLDIVEESLGELHLFAPSSIGSGATAKSVALEPVSSYIADSLYVEVMHVMGVVPAALLVAGVFLLVYRGAGMRGLIVVAVSGLGYLVFEAWIVWFACLCTFSRLPGGRTRRRSADIAPQDAADGLPPGVDHAR